MTKILNLDTFETSNEKSLVLNKETHVFQPFTVEGFIDELKEIEAMEKDGNTPVAAYIEFSIKTILRAFPTIKEADLRKITITKLRAISDFVKSVAEDEAQGATAEAGADSGNGTGAAS